MSFTQGNEGGKDGDKDGGEKKGFVDGLAKLTLGVLDGEKEEKEAPSLEEVQVALLEAWGDLALCLKFCNPWSAAEMLLPEHPEWDANGTVDVLLHIFKQVSETNIGGSSTTSNSSTTISSPSTVTANSSNALINNSTTTVAESNEKDMEKIEIVSKKEKRGKAGKKPFSVEEQLSALMTTVTNQIGYILQIIAGFKDAKKSSHRLSQGTRDKLKSLLKKFNQTQRTGGTKPENLVILTGLFTEMLEYILKLRSNTRI
jgi:hypothetical protein